MNMDTERDEIDLMRYVDGEMDAAERSTFEARMAQDAALRQSIERQRALRQLLQGTYAPVVEEPVPDRLRAALATKRAEAPAVVSLDAERARRRWVPSWAALGGMAASVLLGLVIGHQLQLSSVPPLATEARTGIPVQGDVAYALDTQLSGERVGRVAVGMSFKSRAGDYCRSFTVDASAGLACHSGNGWRVQQLVPAAPAQQGEYRTAATALPPALLQAMDDMREGDVLDARQEAEAKAKGWR